MGVPPPHMMGGLWGPPSPHARHRWGTPMCQGDHGVPYMAGACGVPPSQHQWAPPPPNAGRDGGPQSPHPGSLRGTPLSGDTPHPWTLLILTDEQQHPSCRTLNAILGTYFYHLIRHIKCLNHSKPQQRLSGTFQL